MIVTFVTAAAHGNVHFRLNPLREEPWTLDAILDEIDAASTPSGRYIAVRSEDAVMTTILDRGHIIAIVVPDDIAISDSVKVTALTGVDRAPVIQARGKAHPAL